MAFATANEVVYREYRGNMGVGADDGLGFGMDRDGDQSQTLHAKSCRDSNALSRYTTSST